MSRNLLNYAVDFLALLAFVVLIATGLLLWQALPPGSRGGHGLMLWGMDRHEWGDIHFYVALAMLALMVLHVALHWDWVVAVTRIQILGRKSPAAKPSAARQNLCGLAFLAALVAVVGGFWWAAASSVVDAGESASGGHGRGAAGLRGLGGLGEAHGRGAGEEHGAANFSGRSTLAEAAQQAGVPVDVLKTALGLPPDAPADSRLGQLRRTHGLEMSDIRATVEALADTAP